ncbi:hypothetical protein GCM10010967_15120 [Dyadobacter beijingensis]|uniref:Uncharacterized protein n=1 Tax=Dyadobacter beijingensis TaxID=365489 RepID=A0ABQ2HL99_9BACT|nr:hypothetical protein [Dyadobacter beijingensis]GGM84287.1 hypothetical protein GCM10010967_15120 [Dyadobacter beijingensis]
MGKDDKKLFGKKKGAKKALDEISKGANKIIGENIHGGWVEIMSERLDDEKN